MRDAHPVSDLCGFLSGAWVLRRLGWIGAASPPMRLRGSATFTPDPDGLVWQERGIMRLGLYRAEAEKTTLLRPRGPGLTDILFADGRPFHAMDLSSGLASVWHDCAPDRYAGRYRVLDANRWLLSWRIVGPRKDQRIVSLYTRLTRHP